MTSTQKRKGQAMFTDTYTAGQVAKARHQDLQNDARNVRIKDKGRNRLQRVTVRFAS